MGLAFFSSCSLFANMNTDSLKSWMPHTDCFRIWMPRLIGLLLLVMYRRAIYFDPPVFVGHLCGLCMPQKETPAEVWKATSIQIKGAVYQTGGWAAAFAIMVIWLSF